MLRIEFGFHQMEEIQGIDFCPFPCPVFIGIWEELPDPNDLNIKGDFYVRYGEGGVEREIYRRAFAVLGWNDSHRGKPAKFFLISAAWKFHGIYK